MSIDRQVTVTGDRAGITLTVQSTESRTVIPVPCMAELITVDTPTRHKRSPDRTDSSDRMNNHELVISSRRFKTMR